MCLAIPGQVLEIVDEDNRIARVDVAGVIRNVNVSLLDRSSSSALNGNGSGGASHAAPTGAEPGAQPGDWVLIHVGFALSKVDEDEAQATLRMLQRMGEDYEQELEDLKASAIE